MSEIDDIFSSNPKSKQTRKKKPSSTFKSVEESSSKKRPLVDTVVDTSVDLSGPSKRREKDSIPKSSSKKRPLPETVVDTSTDLPGLSKRRKKDSIPNKNGKSKKSEPTDFGDSRGSGGRKSNHLTFWS